MNWLRANRQTVTFVAIGVVALACIRWAFVRQGQAEEQARHSAVVLRATTDALTQERQRARTVLVQVDTLWRIRTVVLARVDTLRVKADSLSTVAYTLRADTVAACRPLVTALVARTNQCDSLRVVVAHDDTVVATLRETVQRDTTERAELLTQLQTISKPYTCRIIWFVPCLSRVASFVVGGVAGSLLTWRVTR